jgi:hypothetical protein
MGWKPMPRDCRTLTVAVLMEHAHPRSERAKESYHIALPLQREIVLWFGLESPLKRNGM